MPCGEHGLSIADILRDHALCLRPEQAKAVAHILACRTGRLGGHVAFCDRCGARHYAYHSCRNRNCPRCGGLDQRLWAEAQLPHLLPVSYFHVVFTLPASLRPFFAHQGRARALDALFAAVSESILETAARRGSRPGVLAVLHTWNQLLAAHPHLHCLVTGGGLGPQGFVHRRRFLVPLLLSNRVRTPLLGRCREILGAPRQGSHHAHPRHPPPRVNADHRRRSTDPIRLVPRLSPT